MKNDIAAVAVIPGAVAANSATEILANWISAQGNSSISASAFTWAKHVLLDWTAVTIAGFAEPLVQMLVAEYGGDATGPCSLLAGSGRARPLDAALINGCAGHALDFDDVAARMFGHPSVPVVPAALALAQAQRLSGLDLLRALVVGHQVETQLGDMVGLSHYLHGFHVTGTIGTFGASAACANLKRLDAATTAHALGLAATQAAGLKSMFGTMAKPLHAGKAAMNGLMAAQLAARGFTAHVHAIECAQGFAQTQAPQINPIPARIDTSAGFAIESALFKYHAACYMTHSTIEAVRQARVRHKLDLDSVESMTIGVADNHRGVCDIENPQTGLNVKFSIQHLAVLALDGIDTAALDLYSDATALDPRYAAVRARTKLADVDLSNRHGAHVTIRTRDGREIVETANVAIAATDLNAQWDRLVSKAHAITMPIIGAARFEQMIAAIDQLDKAATLDRFIGAVQ